MRLNYPMKSNGMYILKKSDFNVIGENVLQEYMPHVLDCPQTVDIELLARECLYLDIINAHLTTNDSILGMIAFDEIDWEAQNIYCEDEILHLQPGTVAVDLSLIGTENVGRRRFTLAHECSHWICHRAYHSPNNQTYEFRRNSMRSVVACRSENIERKCGEGYFTHFNDGDWEEWQADSLGAAILMPQKTFTEAFFDALSIEGGAFRQDYLVAGADRSLESRVIKRLMYIFNVSYKAASIRLRSLRLIQ